MRISHVLSPAVLFVLLGLVMPMFGQHEEKQGQKAGERQAPQGGRQGGGAPEQHAQAPQQQQHAQAPQQQQRAPEQRQPEARAQQPQQQPHQQPAQQVRPQPEQRPQQAQQTPREQPRQQHAQQQPERKPSPTNAQPQQRMQQAQQTPNGQGQQRQQERGQQMQQAQQQRQPPQQHAQPQRSEVQARSWQQQKGWAQQGGGSPGHATFQQSRAQNWSSAHRSWGQRGGYGGYYIPQDRFNISFGSQHYFRLGILPTMYLGYPRFQYGGFSFLMVDPWPDYWGDNWYNSDDMYIGYDDGYYLYDRRYPGDAVAITIVM